MSQEHIQYKHDKHMPKQKTYKKENLNYIFFFNFKNNKINNKTLCFTKNAKMDTFIA